MESSATGRCIPQKSKKRVFPGSSSCMESVGDRTLKCKNKILKLNDGSVISFSDVMQLDSEDDVSDSHNVKDYIDLCADDYVFEDENTILQPHFDDLDLPTGIEAPIPQFPDSIKMKKKMTPQNATGNTACRKHKWVETSVEPAKDTKTAVGSSSSVFSSLRLQRGAMKFRSVKKLLKNWHHKTPFGPGGSNSNNQVIDLEDVTNQGEIVPMEDVTMDQDSRDNEKSLNVAGSSSNMGQIGNKDEVLRKHRNFKKFDIVEDHSDHHYSSSDSAAMQPQRNWATKIQEEWRILKKDLPDTIFVRVYESRMDLLRAVIMGAEGTPYHDGLFFFDVCFPKNYPLSPPQVYYHSGGLRINPNLYKDGKVCLSLLNTWIGGKNETWRSGSSTMLQVLVSIQGLILNEKPYFNEPEFADSGGSAYGESQSHLYNERTLILSLKTMVYTMSKPPKHFEDMVIGHFQDRACGILTICKGYTKGVGVGCVVEKGEERGSREFKAAVEWYMKTLVGAFTHIGVEDVKEFLPPTKSITQMIKAFFWYLREIM